MSSTYSPKTKNFICVLALVLAIHLAPRKALAIASCNGTPQEIAECIVTFCQSNPQTCNRGTIATIVGGVLSPATWFAINQAIINMTLIGTNTAALAAASEAAAALAGAGGGAAIAGGGAAAVTGGAATGAMISGAVVGVAAGGAVIAGGLVYAILRPDDIAYWLVDAPPSTCTGARAAIMFNLSQSVEKLSKGLCQDLERYSSECLKPPAKLSHTSCFDLRQPVAVAQPPAQNNFGPGRCVNAPPGPGTGGGNFCMPGYQPKISGSSCECVPRNT
jgi:hypothetical protein